MLIKVTNFCSMGCSHCMEGSTRKGTHMSLETFDKALDFSDRVEVMARDIGYRQILLSGGECSEHPEIETMIEKVVARGLNPLLITNGMWLDDLEMRKKLLRPEWKTLLVQVTNDARFYPKRPACFGQPIDPRVVYVDSLTMTMPLGRFAGKTHPDLRQRTAPSSFNIRSMTRTMGDVRKALLMIRMRAMQGKDGNCYPSITDDGRVMAGETRNCFAVGTVDSSPEEITKNLIAMRCNACGLVTGLSQEYKRAIGESNLFLPGEVP